MTGSAKNSSSMTSNESKRMDIQSARDYTRSLARGHYENFIVGSLLVPRRYIQHLYNIYAYCRISDDLADETGDSSKSLELLRDWREELHKCYGGQPSHPAMIALQDTIREFDIPIEPFIDLISAFEQDCSVSRYETYNDLLDYCRRSANPVGRLFLILFGYREDRMFMLSDHICTALQLVNFWQDISEDFNRGRVYIPQEDLKTYGCTESAIASKTFGNNFRELMKFECDRAQQLFDAGAELIPMLDGRIKADVKLFRLGGMAVLDEIRRQDYDVLAKRPKVSKMRQALLFLSCLVYRK